MKKLLFFSIFLLFGCVTLQPMKQSARSQQIANNSDVSKITINAINFSTMRKTLGVDFAVGKIKVNGEELGDFSKNEQTFTQFLSPGQNLIEIALPGTSLKSAIASTSFNVEPNTHYFFDYGFEANIFGTMRNEIKFVRKEPFRTSSNQSIQENNKSTDSKTNKIDNAKKICLDLGFKTNTENFGNCVLKIMNQ